MAKENQTSKKTKPATKFNLNIYIKELNQNVVLWCLALVGIFILFYNPIQSLFDTVFVETIIKSCPQNSFAVDLVVFSVFIYAIIFLIRQYRRKLTIAGNSIIFIITIIFIYIVFFRENPSAKFYFFHIKQLNGIAYWDVFLFSFLMMFATYKSYNEPLTIKPSRHSFIDDAPSLETYDDGYSRGAYAKEIALHINTTTTEGSFAIGVIGEWGSGKTDFLLRLKQALKENTDNCVFDFNPWRVSKPEAIIEEFFKTLSTAVKPFNQSITGKIKDYSKRILQTGKEIQYRFFDTVLNEWIGDETIEKQYLSINKAISNTSKRWVIVIDDVDRLTGKEIMEVLRIVRNTANFGNTFFIIAIDQQYIISALKNVKEFANEEEYLKKVFQLTITLPAFKKQVFIPQLKSLLITEDLSKDEQISITDALSKISTDFGDLAVAFYPVANHDGVLEKMVENVRDLKRFANSFKIAFNILSGEVDIHDLMVLELLRNRNLEVYNLVRDRILLDFNYDRSSEFKLNESAFKDFADKHKETIRQKELDGLKAAVNYLVTETGYKNSRKFISSYNFYLYFAYQLFDLISLKEFNSLIEKTSSEISSAFTQWSNEKKRAELYRVVEQLIDFKDEKFLLKMIIAYLNVKIDHGIWLRQVGKLVFTLRQSNAEKYFEASPKRHKQFLIELMSCVEIDITDRGSIASLFLHEYNNGRADTSLVLRKSEWAKILKDLLDSHLNHTCVIDIDSLNLLYQNIDRIEDDRKAVLSNSALTSFRRALNSNNLFFKNYTELLLRPYSKPYQENGLLVMEPFLEQIFGDWKKFKQKLQRTSFHDEPTQLYKKIVLKYIDNFYDTGKSPFKINDLDDSKFIDKWMSCHFVATITELG